MLRLHPELKSKWADALDSDTFVQGHNRLFDPKTKAHCCLGVLCSVLEEEFPDIKWRNNGRPRMDYWHYIFENINEVEPENLRIEAETFFAQFIKMNDSLGLMFSDIAMFIRHNPTI